MRAFAGLLPMLLASVAVAANHATVQVVVDRPAVPINARANVAFVFTIDPDWHLYWENPGDTGEPPRIEWSLPDGLVHGASLHFPTPHRIDAGGVTAFGYENKLVLLSTLARQKDGPADGTAVVHWMACDAQQCVAEKQTVSIVLATGDGAPAAAEGFKAWQASQPDRPALRGDDAVVDVIIAVDGKHGDIDVPVPPGKTAVDYFPPRFEFLAYKKATVVGKVMRTPFRILSDAPPRSVGRGVVVLKDDTTGAVMSEERGVNFVLNGSESKGAK